MKKKMTIKVAKIITTIITLTAAILLALFILIFIDNVGAALFCMTLGGAIVSCVWSISWTILEHIASSKQKNSH